MTTTPIKRSVAITAIAASTFGGVAAGAAFFTPVIAGAQDDAVEAEQAAPERGERISEALQVLVDDGTLTEAQRDAVVETLKNARPDRGEFREPLGQRGPRVAGEIAEILGLEGNEIREALRNGSSIAELAEAQGIESADVVDAIVARAEERLDTAVENGRIDDTQAAEMLTRTAERAEDLVNGEIEFGGRRGRLS
ncbi:MAG: hypothetical protein VX510_05260 [Actinomycetota bacterium]|nr:hypothetical protein [Acidimicrobiaceae bacterium]MEC7374326.1 hypothetical protein [Actinomycetota bacterium]MEC7403834.1 hypothetical protein [Actinomycetota bacterium]MEC7506198.1 hypothetical protein [Actinomycetota bacterium]MEC7968232.1 hypothetical protein [Actinomycetota bacterium]